MDFEKYRGWIFVACLPFSDYAFAMIVRSECIDDFIYAFKHYQITNKLPVT